MSATSPNHAPPIVATRSPKLAALAAWIGSAMEYDDFFIYGTAATLVFPTLFIPAGDPQTASIASLATFGVAYIARPFGAVILGHSSGRSRRPTSR
jgi:MFS family permease